jgi:hypothetical protein
MGLRIVGFVYQNLQQRRQRRLAIEPVHQAFAEIDENAGIVRIKCGGFATGRYRIVKPVGQTIETAEQLLKTGGLRFERGRLLDQRHAVGNLPTLAEDAAE